MQVNYYAKRINHSALLYTVLRYTHSIPYHSNSTVAGVATKTPNGNGSEDEYYSTFFLALHICLCIS